MENNKIVKIAIVTCHLGITGIGTVIMNYCTALEHDCYDFTIIAGSPIAKQYKKRFDEYGIDIIELPPRHGKALAHYFEMWRALSKGKYDMIHVHGNSSTMLAELLIAKFAGIKKKIVHSHNTLCSNERLHKLLNPYFRKSYNQALACGEKAGEWLFGKGNFVVIPNGFHVSKFYFDINVREEVRSQLNLKDKFVLGHVGRMNGQKNQKYLLEIFESIAAKRDDAVLIMVGTGPMWREIEALVNIHPYKDQIIMYGETESPENLYMAMDVFVYPSKYEGLPITLLEAQICGLPCIISDVITEEVVLSENVQMLSIDECPDLWAEKINCFKQSAERLDFCTKHLKRIEHYDIRETARILKNIYDGLVVQ